MTIDNWIALGAVAATILAPIIKVLFEFALKRGAKTKTTKKLEIVKRPRTIWRRVLNWVLFLVPSVTLITEFLSTDPVTRNTVFIVSLAVASLLFMVVTEIIYQVFGILRSFLRLHEKQASVSEKIVNTLNSTRSKNQKRLTRSSTGRSKAARR